MSRSAEEEAAGEQTAPEAGLPPGISRADLADSAPVASGEEETSGSEAVSRLVAQSWAGRAVSRLVDGANGLAVQRVGEQDTLALCPPYWRWETARDVHTFNCAGLAHRSYDYKSLAATRTALAGATAIGASDRCPAGRVKHWLWEYDLHAESSNGQVLQAASPDFHTVAGVSDQHGNDPTDVYSKNGRRPVYGPATGPSFRPPARERATQNDRSETPINDSSGNPIYKVRTNMRESCYCLPCPSSRP